MLLMKESVFSLKEKITQDWFSYFKIAHKYQKSFMTDPLNLIFDESSLRLLGYRIEFSCLYIAQRQYFMVMWLRWWV